LQKNSKIEKLIISYLANLLKVLKVKHADYQHVSWRSTCSVWKSGTLWIEITNENI